MISEDCWYKDVCNNECSPSCIRYLEMTYLMERSNIPKAKQRPISLYPDNEDYEAFYALADIKDNIVDFVENGENLYITSKTTGNGKTSWAIKLMLKYFDEIWAGNGFRTRGIFVHVPTLLLQLKDFNNPLSSTFKRAIVEVDLVIWDDIASTDMSNYDYTQLLMYIDQRTLNEKANIYTGNINTQAGLEKALGTKLTSRIWKESKVVEFTGKDKRNADT